MLYVETFIKFEEVPINQFTIIIGYDGMRYPIPTYNILPYEFVYIIGRYAC